VDPALNARVYEHLRPHETMRVNDETPALDGAGEDATIELMQPAARHASLQWFSFAYRAGTLAVTLACFCACSSAQEDPATHDARTDTPAADIDSDTVVEPDVSNPVDVDVDDGPDTDVEVLPEPPPSIAFATYNANRFFDTVCDSGRCNDGDFEWQLSNAQFRHKAASVAGAVAALDADVIVLQEIENQACIDALQDALDDPYPIAIIAESPFPGSVEVAVLARGELMEIRTHRDTRIPRPRGGTTTFTRELLEVHIDLDGTHIAVFAVHFRSKNDDDADRRLAEATATRPIVLATAEELPDAIVLLGGDFNDTPGSPPIDALEGDGGLFRMTSELGDNAWTITFRGDRFAIDHLYLATEAAGTYVEGSAEVFHDSSGGFFQSDHAAVRARIALPSFDED